MSFKVVAWALLATLAVATILVFNYWASFQPLSTLVYTGIVLAVAGLANLVFPFQFLGIRKRAAGALILTGGVALAFAALSWPASMIRVRQPRAQLDDIMPEYQFSERHSTRVHARPEEVMQAIRQSTFGDMTSLITLLKIRAVVARTPPVKTGGLQDKRILDAFSEAGYLFDGTDREIAIFGAWNVRLNRRPEVRTVREFAAHRDQDTVKMGYGFHVEEAGAGWSTVTTETRVVALGGVSRGMARYWRLIVPGSGLLRLQWLSGIKNRAESLANLRT